MRRDLVPLLCDPEDQSGLRLETSEAGEFITSGTLVSDTRTFPIVEGIPRFADRDAADVRSFGNEWNYFNYDLFRQNWLTHVVLPNFGSTQAFEGKLVVDCGAGSGMQAKWMAELGADRVLALELSHSVDGVMRRNLAGKPNVDIIQCSIDRPPIRPGAIHGLVICHNVIQHTRSVEETARALWGILGSGELVFNCYLRRPGDFLSMARSAIVYRPLRAMLSRCPFRVTLGYAQVMAALRFVPLLGPLLEKAQFVIRGDVPEGPHRNERRYKQAVLNTFDWYGSHKYQHLKTPAEIEALVLSLQPERSKIRNLDRYLEPRVAPGLAIRLGK